jgi:hypothetical protein
MGAAEVSGPADDRERVGVSRDRITRETSVAVVAAALVVWWPAFTLGAYGVIFFQQLLSVGRVNGHFPDKSRCSTTR